MRPRLLAALVTLALAAGCSARAPGPPAPPASAQVQPPPATTAPGSAAVLAAGDIAACDKDKDEQTAALLDRLPGTVLALGDLVYPQGGSDEFARCYAPSWGRLRARTRPVPGNHDYGVAGARGYYDYFGPAAGGRGTGWYSFDLGAWHLVALNSNCDAVGGCQAGSAQERWLRADLAAHPARCTLAYWHHPRFSSGSTHGSNPQLAGLWSALYDAGADLVLSGHEHNYERFAPLDARGRPDPGRGVREFVVGTGGRSHYPFGRPLQGSEVRNADTYGVLALTLGADGYTWSFEGIQGAAFGDTGAGRCH